MLRKKPNEESSSEVRTGMDLDNFITSLFDSLPAWTEHFLATHYSALGQAVSEPALYLAMVWVAVKVVRVHSGRDPADVWPLARMMLTIVFVFAALNWGGFASQIFHAFTELRDNTLSRFMNGKSAIQFLNDNYNKFEGAAEKLMNHSMMAIGLVLIGLLLNIVNGIMVLVALVLQVGSVLGTAITMVLLPLFAPTFFWSASRGFGMSWIAAMVKFALVGIILGVVVAFSSDIAGQYLEKMNPDTMTAKDAWAAIVLEAAIALFMAFGVRPLASALASSGAAGGGMAEMIGGFMMSQMLSNFTGGGKQGSVAQGLSSISHTQQQQAAQLDRIERSLSSADGARATQEKDGQLSGAGQPGGPGSEHGSAANGGPRW
jgi:type IV secretion system protein VirB6